jgi:hypothetical protein
VNNTGWKAAAPAIGLVIAALALAACGSDNEPERVERPPLSAATANRLASLSEEIAADLDDGDVCTAAGRADELADAIESARIDDRIRPGVEAAATRLVDQVNCPPPPEPEKDEKKKDEEKQGKDEGGEDYGDAVLPEAGDLPPGQKKKIEDGL